MTGNARGICRLYVAWRVADQKAAIVVDRPEREQIQDHAGFGLATAAAPAIVCGVPIGMMRAVFKRIDMRADSRQLFFDPAMEGPDIRFTIIASRHSGLVSDNERVIAAVVAQPHGLPRALQPFEVCRPVQIAYIAVQHTVTIEE